MWPNKDLVFWPNSEILLHAILTSVLLEHIACNPLQLKSCLIFIFSPDFPYLWEFFSSTFQPNFPRKINPVFLLLNSTSMLSSRICLPSPRQQMEFFLYLHFTFPTKVFIIQFPLFFSCCTVKTLSDVAIILFSTFYLSRSRKHTGCLMNQQSNGPADSSRLDPDSL